MLVTPAGKCNSVHELLLLHGEVQRGTAAVLNPNYPGRVGQALNPYFLLLAFSSLPLLKSENFPDNRLRLFLAGTYCFCCAEIISRRKARGSLLAQAGKAAG